MEGVCCLAAGVEEEVTKHGNVHIGHVAHRVDFCMGLHEYLMSIIS